MNDPQPTQADIRCQRIVFEGRVQGVGFRYTAASLAKAYPITGYVKNLANGTVELVVQGRDQDIARLVARIVDGFRGYIERKTVEELIPREEYSGFEIRR